MYLGKFSQELADKIESYVLKNNDNLTWRYSAETAGYDEDSFDSFPIKGSGETFQFENRIYSEKNGIVDPHAWSSIISPMILEYQEDHEDICAKFTGIFRAKMNMLTTDVTDQCKFHTPHVDAIFPHWVMLYYINDSDGPTYFFEQKYNGQKQELTLNRIFNPIKGQFLVFDGLTYHASTSPKKSIQRCVININFT